MMAEEERKTLRDCTKGLCAKVRNTRVCQRAMQSHCVQAGGRLAAKCNAAPFVPQIFLMVFYRISLDAVYKLVLATAYAYEGYLFQPDIFRILLSYLLVLLFAPFVAQLQNQTAPSAKIVTIMHYIYFIPLTSYCSFSARNAMLLPIGAVYWLLLLLWEYKLPILTLRTLSPKHIRLAFVAMSLFSTAVVLYISGRYTGFRCTLNFIDVYGIRAEAATYSIPGVLSYFLGWQTIMLAVEILYWIRQKRYLPTAGLIVVYLFYFSIAAHKSIFFFLLLVLVSATLYRSWMMRWAGGALILLNGASIGVYKLLHSVILASLFVRRVMYVPVYLADCYLSFFSENPLNIFRNGIARWLGYHEVYALEIVHILGEFNGDVNCAANNGLLGNLFANLPISLGLLFMPLLIVGCLRMLDLTAGRISEKIVIPFCVLFAINFINSDWSTILLSGGYLVTCVLLYFFPKEA